VKTLSLPDWQAAGLLRFGHADARLWLFVCPSCGQEQSFKDLRDLGVPHPERYMAYSCIGRFNLNVPARADEVIRPWSGATKGFGCTYSGSENRAPIKLLLPDQERPTFEFAP
jgi:hypothetical protein